MAESRWAIEYEQPAADAFKLNNPGASVYCRDCSVVLAVSGGELRAVGWVWWRARRCGMGVVAVRGGVRAGRVQVGGVERLQTGESGAVVLLPVALPVSPSGWDQTR